jgi:hypothetical protein
MRVREPTELERFLAALTTELGRAGTMDLAGTPVPFAAAEVFAGVPGKEGMPAMLAELKRSLPQK